MATPLALSVPVPNVFVPSRKVTVPVGALGTGLTMAVTVAVKVIGWPKTEGLVDEPTTVCEFSDAVVKSTSLVW